jgi:protein involved in polysaccharide export with SLBB domain
MTLEMSFFERCKRLLIVGFCMGLHGGLVWAQGTSAAGPGNASPLVNPQPSNTGRSGAADGGSNSDDARSLRQPVLRDSGTRDGSREPSRDGMRDGMREGMRDGRREVSRDALRDYLQDLAMDALPEPGEFERLATEANAGKPVRRLGARTRRSDAGLANLEMPARVPPQYVVQVGDEIAVTVWGSVDGHWQTRVDRAGRVNLPRVGPVAVAGATASELEGLLRARLSRTFKAFELAVAVTDVSPVRIHVTGFVELPGDYTVPGLTTLSRAIALAQGPSAGGSFRRIRLQRNDNTVVVFDLYSLLLDGSRRDDRLLQPGDVLYVEAAGPQIAVLGSVNRVAVFEYLQGETLADALRLAGGFSSVADRSALTVERLRDRSQLGALELLLPRDEKAALNDGDLLRVRSQVTAQTPSQLKNKRVLVEGEVNKPGEYLLPASATLADAVQAAGGTTPSAFIYGVALRRESVRLTQEANYDRALREMETEFARASTNRRTNEDNVALSSAMAQQLLMRLRERRPEGRMVLDVTPQSAQLPPIELEDGDRVRVPPSNQGVGVFGSVFSAGSFMHDGTRKIGDYVQRAGGPTSSADYSLAFVVRANGSVVSATEGSRWWRKGPFEELPALPGDTVYVPEEIFRTSWVQSAKDWTQILYQLGVGLAALRIVR